MQNLLHNTFFNVYKKIIYLYIKLYNMKTEVIMKRDLNGIIVSQRSKDKFLNATDLIQQFNEKNKKKKVMAEFWSNKSTEDFIEALSQELSDNVGETLYLEKDLYSAKKGKNGGTYMHPYLFVKFAMWLSPKFEVQVIKWVYDNLIDFRNQAGEHYSEMCEAIKEKYIQYFHKSPNPIVFIKEANFLNSLVYGEYKGKKRNMSSEKQLQLLNQLQKANIFYINQNMGKFDRKEKLREIALMFS